MQPTLDGQGGEGPDQSLLAGAVDLGHPIQQAGRAFLTALAKQGGHHELGFSSLERSERAKRV